MNGYVGSSDESTISNVEKKGKRRDGETRTAEGGVGGCSSLVIAS